MNWLTRLLTTVLMAATTSSGLRAPARGSPHPIRDALARFVLGAKRRRPALYLLHARDYLAMRIAQPIAALVGHRSHSSHRSHASHASHRSSSVGSTGSYSPPSPPPAPVRDTSARIPNTAPTVEPIDVTTPEDSPVTLPLKGADAEGQQLAFEVASAPSHGAAFIHAGRATYAPDPDFNGLDSFSYLATDGVDRSSPATVTVHVTPQNDPPVVLPQFVSTPKNSTLRIRLTATDPDADPLSFEISTRPSHGTLSGETPMISYSPAMGFTGMDSFTYTASDGKARVTGTVSIRVTTK